MMKARLKVGGTWMMLTHIHREDMEKLLADPPTALIKGIPAHFDLERRIWPAPLPDLPAVEFFETVEA
jgi:hypothetical protein